MWLYWVNSSLSDFHLCTVSKENLAATVYCWSQGGNGCDSTRHGPQSAGNRKACPTVWYYLSCGGDCGEEWWDSSRIKSCLSLLEVNSFLTRLVQYARQRKFLTHGQFNHSVTFAVPRHNLMVIGHLNCSTASCTVMWHKRLPCHFCVTHTTVVSTYMHSCCCH